MIDALLILNYLDRQSGGVSSIYNEPVYLDVSGDGQVQVLDGLRVINELNRVSLALNSIANRNSNRLSTAINEPTRVLTNTSATRLRMATARIDIVPDSTDNGSTSETAAIATLDRTSRPSTTATSTRPAKCNDDHDSTSSDDAEVAPSINLAIHLMS